MSDRAVVYGYANARRLAGDGDGGATPRPSTADRLVEDEHACGPQVAAGWAAHPTTRALIDQRVRACSTGRRLRPCRTWTERLVDADKQTTT
jgi:hypothetical protein